MLIKSFAVLRAVDFLYMPDTMIEEARNVSVNLHGEHGRFKEDIISFNVSLFICARTH